MLGVCLQVEGAVLLSKFQLKSQTIMVIGDSVLDILEGHISSYGSTIREQISEWLEKCGAMARGGKSLFSIGNLCHAEVQYSMLGVPDCHSAHEFMDFDAVLQ